MNRILVIPRLHVQNANALSSPYTIGLPAMTAFLGAVHALQRFLNAGNFPALRFKGVGVACHDIKLQTYRDPRDYVWSIIGTANPLVPDTKWDAPFKRPAFIEEARCHLQVSLVIEYEGLEKDDEEDAQADITSLLNAKMKLAGGDILKFGKPSFLRMDNEGKDFARLMRSLMPGHVIIERRDLMAQAMSEGADAITALLDHLKVMHRSEIHTGEKGKERKIVWTSKRKESGWLVPVAVGFQGISELGRAHFQRDPNTPHCFAEAVVTLGEFVMSYRIKTLDRVLWHYYTDPADRLYLCRQNVQENFC